MYYKIPKEQYNYRRNMFFDIQTDTFYQKYPVYNLLNTSVILFFIFSKGFVILSFFPFPSPLFMTTEHMLYNSLCPSVQPSAIYFALKLMYAVIL